MDWVGLEGTFKDHLVQPPCSEQGHLQLDQVAQSPIQPDPECFQGWGICHVSVSSVQHYLILATLNFYPSCVISDLEAIQFLR